MSTRTTSVRPLPASTEPESWEDQVKCSCGQQAALRTSGPKTRNAGRKFFTCPKYSEEPTHCTFFKWRDELSGPGAPAISSSTVPMIPMTPKKTAGAAPRTPVSGRTRDPLASARRVANIQAVLDAAAGKTNNSPASTSNSPGPSSGPSAPVKIEKIDKGKRRAVSPEWEHFNDDAEFSLEVLQAVDEHGTKRTKTNGYLTPRTTPSTSRADVADMDDAENNPFLVKDTQSSVWTLSTVGDVSPQSSQNVFPPGSRLAQMENRLAANERRSEEQGNKIRQLEARIAVLEREKRTLEGTVQTLQQMVVGPDV